MKNKLEIECLCSWPGYAGTTTNLQIILNTPKNPYLNEATQKNTCQVFLPKKSWNRKFQTQKTPIGCLSVDMSAD